MTKNLLTRGMRGPANTLSGISFAWDGDWYHVSGTATNDIGWRAYQSSDIPVKAGRTYTLLIDFDGDVPDGYSRLALQFFTDFKKNVYINVAVIYRDPLHVTFTVPDGDYEMLQLWGPIIKGGATVDLRCRLMLVEGGTPYACAPAEGEMLVGVGALMSANLLDDVMPKLVNGAAELDGVISIAANNGSERHVAEYSGISGEILSANQTCHIGISLRAASGGDEWVSTVVEYKDSAGHPNGVSNVIAVTGDGSWHRHDMNVVVPSGMRVTGFHFNQKANGTAIDFAKPCLSYGSPVVLASAEHVRSDIVRVPLAVCDNMMHMRVSSCQLSIEIQAIIH